MNRFLHLSPTAKGVLKHALFYVHKSVHHMSYAESKDTLKHALEQLKVCILIYFGD